MGIAYLYLILRKAHSNPWKPQLAFVYEAASTFTLTNWTLLDGYDSKHCSTTVPVGFSDIVIKYYGQVLNAALSFSQQMKNNCKITA